MWGLHYDIYMQAAESSYRDPIDYQWTEIGLVVLNSWRKEVWR